MTAIIIANSIAAAIVVAGLAAAMRLGHHTASGGFERTLRRFQLHRGRGDASGQTKLRRAA
jgi:hypothetical protein